MLTEQILRDMKPGEVFARGIIQDNTYCRNYRTIGKWIKRIAKRGDIHDWTIYWLYEDQPKSYIETNGDKITNPDIIQRLVKCDESAMKLYRF